MKKNILLILLSFYISFLASTNASAEALKCEFLFQDKSSQIDILDKDQFFTNLDRKINFSFTSQNEIKKYFEHSTQPLILYTSTDGYQKYYDQLGETKLDTKTKAISMRSEIENALFLRKAHVGEVYSGAHLNKSYIDELSNVGKTIKFDYFLSTSKDYSTAIQFSKINNFHVNPEKRKVIFIIQSLNGKSIEDISEYRYEREVLFSATSEFKVEAIKDEKKNNQDLRLIYLNEIRHSKSENFNKQLVNDLKSQPKELQDWRKGLEYIFANSRHLKYDLFDLKEIHKIVSDSMTFEKSVQREKSLKNMTDSRLLKKSGMTRSTEADYFISNGDNIDSDGQRYFKPHELEGYLDNPFFFVKILKKRTDNNIAADVHFVSPHEVELITQRVLAEAQVALIKSRTDRQYLLNVFKLYRALISIHPFSDANGRSVRLFIYGLLLKRNFPVEYFPTLSEYENSAARLVEDYLNGNQYSLD